MILFIVHNGVWLVRNQLEMPCWVKLCRSPQDLAEAAAVSTNRVVAGRFAAFYELRRDYAGASLVVPSWMSPHAEQLSEIARVQVTIGAERHVVRAGEVAALLRASHEDGRWLRRGGSRELWQGLHLVADPGSRRIVLAEAPATYGELFVLTVEHFAQVEERGEP